MKRPHVVLGVCGGVASYKAVHLARLMQGAGIKVSVVMTANAHQFIGAHTFAALTDQPVRTSLWDSPEPSPHTTLGQSADLFVVAPATARLIASYANGLCDDLLSNTLVASRAPVLMAPAMHTEMWENPGVAANVSVLKQRGVNFVGPATGPLAGGDSGVGRLAEPEAIFQGVQQLLARKRDLEGVKMLVTAGGTREAIDPVRFIGNRSSGKQGIAIALDAAARGAEVQLVSTVDAPAHLSTTSVTTADEMHAACLKLAPEMDVVVMAAAVADFRPAEVSVQKIKKSDEPPVIQLQPTVDVLKELGSVKKPNQTLIGFAAETSTNGEDHAKAKLEHKNLDAIVLNDVSSNASGFEVDTNTVKMIFSDGHATTWAGEKRTVASHINTEIVRLIASRRTPSTSDADTHN